MTGAESLLRTAVDARIDVCFANPGTTEMDIVAALDVSPEIRSVLGLFEGVCTGMADGHFSIEGLAWSRHAFSYSSQRPRDAPGLPCGPYRRRDRRA